MQVSLTFLLAVLNICFDIGSQNCLERNKKVLEFKKDIITNLKHFILLFLIYSKIDTFKTNIFFKYQRAQ